MAEISIKKAKKMFNLWCVDCGVEFKAKTSRALRCEVCRVEAKKIQRNDSIKKRRAACRANCGASYTQQPKKSISEVLKDLKKHNEEHGTFLSYGQYVLMIERGVS